MDGIYTPRVFGDKLNLPHREVVRRINRGDIPAEKVGWNWIIKEEAVDVVRGSSWYRRYQQRHSVTA